MSNLDFDYFNNSIDEFDYLDNEFSLIDNVNSNISEDDKLLKILSELNIEFVEDEIFDDKLQTSIQIAMIRVPHGFFENYPDFKNNNYIKNRRVYYLEANKD